MRAADLHIWAHCVAKKGDKVVYMEKQPCTWPKMAHMATELTEQGLITTVSKKIHDGSGLDRKATWEAVAIKL